MDEAHEDHFSDGVHLHVYSQHTVPPGRNIITLRIIQILEISRDSIPFDSADGVRREREFGRGRSLSNRCQFPAKLGDRITTRCQSQHTADVYDIPVLSEDRNPMLSTVSLYSSSLCCRTSNEYL